MTGFWIVAGIMLLAALALLAPALLRARPLAATPREAQNVAIARERLRELETERDRGELSAAAFAQARRELELSLADDIAEDKAGVSIAPASSRTGRLSLFALVVTVPALTLGMYFQLGAPELLQGNLVASGSPGPHATAAGETPSLQQLVAALEERLAAEPDNVDGWFMLARTYMTLGRFNDAVPALERVRELAGDEPSVLISLADAIAMTQGGRVSGRPAELAEQALTAEPDNATALWLAGTAADERGDFSQAVAYWRKVEPQVLDRPELLTELRSLIADAEQRARAAGQEITAGRAAAQQVTEASAPTVTVSVALDPALAAEVAPEQLVFIFARAPQGPPMPLAVARKNVDDLPVVVQLDDSQAMMPAMKLSNFEQVSVVARVSKTGSPAAQSGDLESEPQLVKPAESPELQLTISRRVP